MKTMFGRNLLRSTNRATIHRAFFTRPRFAAQSLAFSASFGLAQLHTSSPAFAGSPQFGESTAIRF